MAEGIIVGILERYALPGKAEAVSEFIRETLATPPPPGLQAEYALANVDDAASFLLFTVWANEISRQRYIRSDAFRPLFERAQALYDPGATTARTLAFVRRRGLCAREAKGPVISVRQWVAWPATADRAAELVASDPLPEGMQSEYVLRGVDRTDHFVFVTLWDSMALRGRFLNSPDHRALVEREPVSLFDPAHSRTRIFELLARRALSGE